LAVAFGAIGAEESFLVNLLSVIAVSAFRWLRKHLGYHHALVLLLPRFSVLSEAVTFFAHSNRLSLSLELHHLLSQKLNHFHVVLFKQLHVVVSQAQMLVEFSSFERFAANVALDLDFRAVFFNMVSQLGSSHVLEFLEITNVTSVLRALVVLSMLLQLSHSFP